MNPNIALTLSKASPCTVNRNEWEDLEKFIAEDCLWSATQAGSL
jgi:hypothetical protein